MAFLLDLPCGGRKFSAYNALHYIELHRNGNTAQLYIRLRYTINIKLLYIESLLKHYVTLH